MLDNPALFKNDVRVGFARRLGAYSIDILITLLIGGGSGMILCAIFIGVDLNTKYDNGNTDLNWAGIFGGFFGAFFGTILGFFAFNILLGFIEGITGWTPGKGMIKIGIMHKSGKKAHIVILFLRFILKYSPCFFWTIFFYNIMFSKGSIDNYAAIIGQYAIIAMLLSIIVFISGLFVFGNNKQALYDLITQTAVFKISSFN